MVNDITIEHYAAVFSAKMKVIGSMFYDSLFTTPSRSLLLHLLLRLLHRSFNVKKAQAS